MPGDAVAGEIENVPEDGLVAQVSLCEADVNATETTVQDRAVEPCLSSPGMQQYAVALEQVQALLVASDAVVSKLARLY